MTDTPDLQEDSQAIDSQAQAESQATEDSQTKDETTTEAQEVKDEPEAKADETKDKDETDVKIHKVRPSTRYTILLNSVLQDKTLSPESKGVYAEICSLPEDFTLRAKFFIRPPHTGRDKVRRIMRELTERGNLKLVRAQDEQGKFINTYYEFFADADDNPDYTRQPENPSDGQAEGRSNRQTDNRPLQSKEIDKDNTDTKSLVPKDGADAESDSDSPQTDLSLTDDEILKQLTRQPVRIETLAKRLSLSETDVEALERRLKDFTGQDCLELRTNSSGARLVRLTENGRDIKKGHASNSDVHKRASAFLQIYHDRLTRVHGASIDLNSLRREQYSDARAIARHSMSIKANEFATALDNFYESDWYKEHNQVPSMLGISKTIHTKVTAIREATKSVLTQASDTERRSRWTQGANPLTQATS